MALYISDDIVIKDNKITTAESNADLQILPNGSGALQIDQINISGNEITTNDTNANLELSANSSGYVQVMGTGAMVVPASTTGNRPTGVTGMLRHNTTTGNFEGYDGSSWGSLAGSTSASEDSDNTATKTKVQIGTSVVNIDTWTTSSYWSAKYNYVAYDEVNSEMQTGIIHIVHDSTTAYMSEYGKTETGSTAFLTFTADISGGYVRLRGVGTSTTNSVTVFRTALGTSSSADSSSTNTGLTLVSDLDSSQAALDTTAFATYRGVSYFIVANNAGGDDSTVGFECLKINATHDGTTAYHSEYGRTSTTSGHMVTYDVDISGSSLRLLGTSSAANTVIKIYKIMVKDTEEAATSDSVNIITNTDVDSAIENVNTFENSVDEDTTFQAVHYFNTVKSADEEEYQVSEIVCVGDGGNNIYESEFGIVTSGNRQLVTYTTDYSNTTGRLRAVGATTDLVINGYRINLKRKGGGVAASSVVLTSSAQTIAGAKTFSTSLALASGATVTGILDEDAMGSDSAVKLATQQSIKAYIDSRHTGGTVNFLDSATNYLAISKDGNDALFQSSISDGDIVFKGNDAGSTTSMLWLNASERGDAYFNNDVNVGNDLMIEDYIWFENDGQSIYWGSDSDIELIHVHNTGLILKNRLGTDDTPMVLTLQTAETTITSGEKIGVIDFQAPSESSGTDAILVAAGIEAVAEGTFAADNNATKLSFKTAASDTATETMSLSSAGNLTISGTVAMEVGSDPSTVANHAHVYAKDDTSSAEVYVRDEAGNVTKLSPHNKQGEWEYFSKNVNTGKVVRVNMEEMIKDIEKLTGKKYIKDE